MLRRLALALWYLTDKTRHPQRLADLLDVLSDEEALQDASEAELELVAKEVECIAAGGNDLVDIFCSLPICFNKMHCHTWVGGRSTAQTTR